MNFDSNAEFVNTVAKESLVVLNKLGARTRASISISSIGIFEGRRHTQIASGHFGNFDDILLEEDLEETDYENQYPSVQDWELSYEIDTFRNRLGSG